MADCRHHWLLSSPQADIVLGRCKHCQLNRVFPARLGDPKAAIRWFERTRRMEAAKARPEIVRLTRDRWADARALMQESA